MTITVLQASTNQDCKKRKDNNKRNVQKWQNLSCNLDQLKIARSDFLSQLPTKSYWMSY
jgi:hypothetical protein